MAFWIWIWIFDWRTLVLFFLAFLILILSEHGEHVSSLKMLALIPVAFCSHFILWERIRLHIYLARVFLHIPASNGLSTCESSLVSFHVGYPQLPSAF
ncbi:uncharacterized protein BDV14DRAFT_123066 [Aspergillus stella-maris]|uniref:uncharacterized protein n=1 Tax=Aspergillus stella-maris TaxID=1810926 RepID=UPI003CCD29C7